MWLFEITHQQLKNICNPHWLHVTPLISSDFLLLDFKEGFSRCLKRFLVCFSRDLFCRYSHKMSLQTYFFPVLFQFLLFDCWPFEFLGTRGNMHVSLRSNGQSPLWLPTPNHSSWPSSRVSFVSVCFSVSLPIHILSFQLLAICVLVVLFLWDFVLYLCPVFLTWCVRLSLCIFVEYYVVIVIISVL